jgi:hypothetical protein
MPEDQDIRQSLARAFDRARDRYYRSGRVTMNQDVARTELQGNWFSFRDKACGTSGVFAQPRSYICAG